MFEVGDRGEVFSDIYDKTSKPPNLIEEINKYTEPRRKGQAPALCRGDCARIWEVRLIEETTIREGKTYAAWKKEGFE